MHPSTHTHTHTHRHFFLPVVLYELFQFHDFSDSLKPLDLDSVPHSSQKQHHCLLTTANNKNIGRQTFKKIWVQYLPGNMIHNYAMVSHAILASIIWGISYFICRGCCTVYPPLQKNKAIYLNNASRKMA